MQTEIILLIVGMAVVTFLTRFLGIAAFRNMKFSDRAVRWLRYIPIAILTVLITPTILTPHGELDISLGNDYLVAGLVSTIVAYKTKNIVATVGAGMIIVLTSRLFFGGQ